MSLPTDGSGAQFGCQAEDVAEIAGGVQRRARSLRAQHPEVVDTVHTMIRSTPPQGYAGCCHAIAGLNLTERLQALTLPTLIIVGADDPATPVAASRTIHEQMQGSELVILESAAHLSNLEQPEAFNHVWTWPHDRGHMWEAISPHPSH